MLKVIWEFAKSGDGFGGVLLVLGAALLIMLILGIWHDTASSHALYGDLIPPRKDMH